jgi:hypothetical protein
VSTPIYFPRYTIGVLPALAILLARGLLNFKMPSLCWGLATVVAVMGLFTLPRFYLREREDWRGAAVVFSDLCGKGDRALIMPRLLSPNVPLTMNEALRYYLPAEETVGATLTGVDSLAEARRMVEGTNLANGADRAWILIRGHDREEGSPSGFHLEFPGRIGIVMVEGKGSERKK